MKMNSPKIRFKGYTEDWEQRKLGEIITEYKETVDSECTLPILTSSKTEGVILQEEHFGRKQQHDITGYNILPRNYCTYRNRSDGVDFTFNINKCCDKGIISKFYPVFSGKNSDVFFLSLVLNNSDGVVREIAYTCTGTGQKVLSFLDLQKMKVRVPSYDEQKEIAAYFENLDHLITLHQRKCEQTKTLKKYMLQKMFPQEGQKVPEIRFEGFTGDWEQRKVSEIAIEKLSNGIMNNQVNDETGLRHINVINMYDPDKIHPEKLTFSGYDEDAVKKCNVELGDIFLTRSSLKPEGIAEANVLLDSGRFVYDDHLIRLKVDKEKYDPFFVKLNLSERAFKRQFIIRAKTTAFTTIGQEDIAECSGLFPEKKEQEKIGTYFSQLDHLITLHQREYEKLQELKKFMLQNMFV